MMVKCTIPFILVSLATTAAGANEPARTIAVVGEGTAVSQPDMAMFDAAVVTQHEDAARAVAANSESVRHVMDALKQTGIAERDLQTSRFDIRPMYPNARGQRDPKIIGYQVTNQVSVKVRDLSKLGSVLDAVVEAGINQIHSIRFDIDNKSDVLAEARRKAIQNAKAKAEQYAESAGVKVGSVIAIREGAVATPMPHQPMMRAMADSSVPVATGEHSTQVSVNVVYELKD